MAARHAQSVADDGLHDLDVSVAQVGALFVIAPGQAATIGDIAETLKMAQSAASTLAQRMEKAGLVSREADVADARVTLLRLTPDGAKMRAEAARRVDRMNRLMAQDFSQAELEVVARWLGYIADLETMN
jgi:DNA-binding MarR family transcriptional regulator